MALGTWLAAFLAHQFLGGLSLFGELFAGAEARVANGLTHSFLGLFAYLALLVFVFKNRLVVQALATFKQPASPGGWRVALIALAIEVGVLVAIFVDQPARIFEPSLFNLVTSVETALEGGLVEETIFRGYIILRLASAGFSRTTQAVLSALLFSAIHISWSQAALDQGILMMLSPFFGTFVLGVVLAIAFQLSGHRLMPVAFAHAAINLTVQPWLALAYFDGV